MQIRRVREDDLEQMVLLERELFKEPWTKEGFADALRMGGNLYLAAADESGEVLGYCGYYRSFTEADITNVAVARKHQRKGVGRALLQRLIEEGRSEGVEDFTLEVRRSNRPAIALYESLGFETEGFRPRFYSMPVEDAAIMWLRTCRKTGSTDAGCSDYKKTAGSFS